MRKFLHVFFVLLILIAGSNLASAAPKWDQSADRIEKTLLQALEVYKADDPAGAKKLVNDSYYGIYEKDGLEMTIRNTVSSKNSNLSEYKFSTIKKLMTNQAPDAQIKQEIDTLMKMIRADIKKIKGAGGKHSAWDTFWPAFVILVREGVEAILVIGAIIAYLIKSGNAKKVQTVYSYSLAALLASLLTAVLFQSVVALSGASQEILEGGTMLLAVAVLVSISFWMGDKANGKAWSSYIEGKVQSSLTSGNTLALGAAAFLAVYREGAEVVLFYQALFNEAGDDMQMIWLGFAAGCVVLAAIFIAVRYGTLKIPLKPFFVGTSIFMYCMAVSFAGNGVKELQEGGVIGVTTIDGLPSVDLFGVYPTWETLIPQIALVAVAITGIVYRRKTKIEEAI